jgi:tetratricopeptide (TPR) repeat protein
MKERTELTLQACFQLLSLGWRMGSSEAEAAAAYEEGRALAERTGDHRTLAMLAGVYGLVRLSIAGSALDYVRYGEEGARIAALCDDPGLRAGVGVFPAYAHVIAGDGRACLEWSARVLEEVGTDNVIGKEIVGVSPRAAAIMVRGHALVVLGRLEEAWSQVRVGERVAEESRELEVLGWSQMSWAFLAYTCGGTESVLEHGRRSLEIAEKLDNESSRVFGYLALGIAYLVDAQPAAAREALRESAASPLERHTGRQLLHMTLPLLAEAHLALGDRAEALAVAHETIDQGRAGDHRYSEAHGQLALAGALLATDGVVPRAEIESALERAERLVESIEGRSLSPRILEMRGRLAAALGDVPASGRALREALELYRAIGATGHAEGCELFLLRSRKPCASKVLPRRCGDSGFAAPLAMPNCREEQSSAWSAASPSSRPRSQNRSRTLAPTRRNI